MKYGIWIDKQNYIDFNSEDELIKYLETIKNDNIVIEITMQSFPIYESFRLK